MLCYLNILPCLCFCYLVEKKTYERGKIFFNLYTFLNPKISFFIGKEEGGVFVLSATLKIFDKLINCFLDIDFIDKE